MRLSFTTMATPEQTGIESIKMAKKYGYDGIDLRVSDKFGELELSSSDDELNELKGALNSEGIQLAGLFCYNAKGIEGDKKSWDDVEKSLLQHLELAYKMGSPSIRMFAGNPYEAKDSDRYIKMTAEATAKALQKDTSGIEIVLQNHKYGFTVMDAAKLVKEVGNSRLGLAFSPDHCVKMEEDLLDVYREAKKITKQFYVADGVIDGEKMHHKLPGEGIIPIFDAFQAIGGINFNGWVTFKWEKIWNREIQEPEVALPHFIEYIKNDILKKYSQ